MRIRPAGLITDRHHAVLTMRYQYGASYVYVLPGGNPDPGETLAEALQRELWEELEVRAEIQELILMGEVLHFPGRTDTLHCLFRVFIGDQLPRINPENTSAKDIVWLAPEMLKEVTLYPNFSEQLKYAGASSPFPLYTGALQQTYHE